MRVRVTPRVLAWLDGTGIGQNLMRLDLNREVSPDDLRSLLDDPEDEMQVATMIVKVKQAPARKDGSMWPDLTRAEIKELLEWSDFMLNANADAAADASRSGDMDGMADYNAARAQHRRCQVALEKDNG